METTELRRYLKLIAAELVPLRTRASTAKVKGYPACELRDKIEKLEARWEEIVAALKERGA